MNWRDLVAKLRPMQPPLTEALVRASADRSGQINRRAFLGLCGAGVAAMALDPEHLLWTGPKPSIIVPDRTLETATTIEEAVRKSLTILWPDGTRHDIVGALDYYGGFENLRRMVKAEGGEIITERKWVDAFKRDEPRQAVADADAAKYSSSAEQRHAERMKIRSLFSGTTRDIEAAEQRFTNRRRVTLD
jgi:hypothetical protein